MLPFMVPRAAYWIGSQAGRFYATQTADVGSIGQRQLRETLEGVSRGEAAVEQDQNRHLLARLFGRADILRDAIDRCDRVVEDLFQRVPVPLIRVESEMGPQAHDDGVVVDRPLEDPVTGDTLSSALNMAHTGLLAFRAESREQGVDPFRGLFRARGLQPFGVERAAQGNGADRFPDAGEVQDHEAGELGPLPLGHE